MEDSSMYEDTISQAVLSDDQRALHAALSKKHHQLAVMYLSAILEFQGANPDKLALAAHALRELMEKTPRYIPAPVREEALNQKGVTTLKAKVRALEDAWETTKKRTKVTQPWSGELDRPLSDFLHSLDRFFAQVNAELPRRVEDVRTALVRLDPTILGLPEDVEMQQVKEWQECHNYFEGISHHNPGQRPDEFERWLTRLEHLLLALLIPRTFETFAQLDAIIAEGEGNA